MKRISTVSTRPPKAPASDPMVSPTIAPNPPQLVDPEQVLGRGARVDAGPDDRQVLVARLVGGQQRREHGHEHEQADQYQADHRAGAAQQPLPRVGPAADDLVAFDLEFLGLGLGQAHRMLTSPGSAGRAWRR
jgi:hypothetical protein